MNSEEEQPKIRFLAFTNNEEDAEKTAKLKEAAARLEKAIANDKNISELVDYVPQDDDDQVDLANDTRSLYERLQEQKNKKKEEFEESQKLSNLVSGLDEDEVNYLNQIEEQKRELETRRKLEAYDILEAKKRLDSMKEGQTKPKKSLLIPTSSNSNKSIFKSSLISKIKVKSKVKKPKESSSSDITNEPIR